MILAIYSWDMLLALLALLGALAAFGGQATIRNRTVSVSIGEQILAGFSSAAYAAVLIVLATLLTRRQVWVRQAQIATFAAAIALGAASLLVALLPGQGAQASQLLTALLVLLLDAVGVVMLTGPRVKQWYTTPGSMPRYISGAVGFWALSSVALIILQALR